MAKQDDYVRYTIRVPADLYGKIQGLADQTRRSVNAEIVEILETFFSDKKPSPAFLAKYEERMNEVKALVGDLLVELRGQREERDKLLEELASKDAKELSPSSKGEEQSPRGRRALDLETDEEKAAKKKPKTSKDRE